MRCRGFQWANLDNLIRNAIACRIFDVAKSSPGGTTSLAEMLTELSSGRGRGGRVSNVLESVCQLDDDLMLNLAQRTHTEVEDLVREVDTRLPWLPFRFRLFLSHVAEKKLNALELSRELEAFGVQAFVAHHHIGPGRVWRDQIRLALQTCDALVALMSPGFHESQWTDQEIGFVLGSGRLAVAVNQGVAPYGFIADLQAFDGAGKPMATLAKEMFEVFAANEKTQEAIAEAIVMQLMASDCYADTKTNITLVERLPGKYPSLATRLMAAKLTNSQVRGEFRAPKKINVLLREWTSIPVTERQQA
jgi:hypothetical protein